MVTFGSNYNNTEIGLTLAGDDRWRAGRACRNFWIGSCGGDFVERVLEAETVSYFKLGALFKSLSNSNPLVYCSDTSCPILHQQIQRFHVFRWVPLQGSVQPISRHREFRVVIASCILPFCFPTIAGKLTANNPID